MAKVSVVIPIYNVEPYLKACLDSVVNQTLQDIEIICVNDGSTDNSLSIIKEYAGNDSRIKIIDKANSGYGDSMNQGIDMATGEYLGIVEPDDYVVPEMFEELASVADRENADIVKADFYRFVNDDDDNVVRTYIQLTKLERYYNRLIDPTKEQEVFKFVMNTWSGIYRMSFLNKFHIRHNTTPGASFQDNGFWFKGFCLTHRLYFVNRPYYMNRRDNPNSSVKNPEKVYCANVEYDYIKNFLVEQNLFDLFKDVFLMKLYHNCNFTLGRIANEFKLEYLKKFSEEFAPYLEEKAIREPYFTRQDIKKLNILVSDYQEYYSNCIETSDNKETLMRRNRELREQLYYQTNSLSFRVGRLITYIPRVVRDAIKK